MILENKRDLNLLAVSSRGLTHRQPLDVLHSECLSEFNKTELLKVQDVPDTEKILSFKNGIGMVLRLVPAGKFDMGASGSVLTQNAGRVRKVSISRSFWMGEAEVIQEQFLSVCGYNPSEYQRETTGNANLSTDLPRDNATWFEAVRDCKRLSEMQTERKQGNSYRLPTEAEREYVCRAGTKMPFSFGGFKKLRGQEA